LSGSFRSGSTSLILMTAAHCGQHELVAVGEGGDEINKYMWSSKRIILPFQ
jgi:hypothetical protein